MPTAAEALTHYAARLCDYAASNVSGEFVRRGRAYAEQVRAAVSPTVLAYISDDTCDHLAARRILDDEEFRELAEAASIGGITWCVDQRIHLDAIRLVPTIAQAMSPETANDWARYSSEVEVYLTQPNLLASEAIERVANWVERVTCLVETIESQQVRTTDKQLRQIQETLDRLVARETVREFYSTDEFANLVGRAEFTVREWCRAGRIQAEKRSSGRGSSLAWAISHDEFLRFQRDGLLPAVR